MLIRFSVLRGFKLMNVMACCFSMISLLLYVGESFLF